jgi:benzoyl-CoA reductase/2-hydroxyglutaryl-CoA dehydratase subunit BcrC/BadD/HgdB
MRDLKHLILFEDLLQDAHNALVSQAKEEGKIALGYTCSYIPEVLLNLQGCFGVRLRAPRSGAPNIATYYLTNRNCPFTSCILERAIEGGYNFLNALMGSETCAAMDRAQEHFERLNLVENDKFFTTHLDAPLKNDADSIKFYKSQLILKVLNPIHDTYGIDISEKALLDAIKRHNEVCRIITEIGNFRKDPNPVITGYEFHVINLISLCCPQHLVLEMLKETLEELKTREPDPNPPFKARVVVVGSEIDDPEFTKLLEMCGALVVADRYCFGSFPGRDTIELLDGESAMDAIARHYLDNNECPRFMNHQKVNGRRNYIKKLFEEFHADGVIFEAMKFCEYWGFERTLASHILTNEMDIPCCSIERDYTISSSGQLRTRFQAFVESLEIKKIIKNKEKSVNE